MYSRLRPSHVQLFDKLSKTCEGCIPVWTRGLHFRLGAVHQKLSIKHTQIEQKDQVANVKRFIKNSISVKPNVQPFSTCSTLYSADKPDTERGKLVYAGLIGDKIKYCKVFSLFTSAMGLAFQPVLFTKTEGIPFSIQLAAGGAVTFFIVATPLLLNWVTKRYVLDLYFNERRKEFTAYTYTLFMRRVETKFTVEDIKYPEVPGMLTTVVVKDNIPLFMDPLAFTDRNAYIHLMGYDKPLEWELPLEKKNEK